MAERLEGVTYRTAVCITCGFLALFLIKVSTALAYPTVDPTNQNALPTGAPPGTELPETDVNGLQNQLLLTNPAAVPNANAWTIIPRVTIQELFTDNVLEAASPRRADAITVVSPGISAVADTARLKLNLDYQPDLMLHAIDGPLNAITEHLTTTGLVTLVPDLAFIDLRALAGVQSTGGALATAGNLGSTNVGPQYATPGQTGVNPRNEVQTSSIGISPYLLRQFKDYGTGKLGVSIDASQYSSITGFAANPFSSSGSNSQSLLATEQIAQFTTGEFLGRVQSAFSADFLQSRGQGQIGATVPVVTAGGTVITAPVNSYTSQRETIMDTVTYQMNRPLALIGAIGEQHIQYSHEIGPEVSGITWKAGFTLTPSEESAVTLTYGRFNGVDGFQANGHLALTERTLFSFDYSNTVGTQLESLQNQLNNSTVNASGQLVNAQTGGPNFIASNTLGVQTGVFRYQTLNTSLTTTWLRDAVQAYATWSIQTNATPGNVQTTEFIDPATGQVIFLGQPVTGTGQSVDVKTVNISWLHELTPDMTLNSGASYSFVHRSGNLGNDSAVAASVGLQYMLSRSASLTGRYAFYDRVSKIPGYNLYENILLVGFTKSF
ncbi:MAG: outer membrane beta-barrel protein [Acetobacteraceae bacterium]